MTPEELWKLDHKEFNKWRRQNDLKTLFDCFQKTLPHFDEWLSVYKFTIEFILSTDKPGSFFYWNKETLLIKSNEEDFDHYFFVPIEDRYHDNRLNKISKEKKENLEQFRFKPYFLWAKERLGTDKISKTMSSGAFDTFRYVGWTAPDVSEMCSATISPGISVLKLGGTKINGWGVTTSRNLDFTNLDFLEINGTHHWDREHNIFYSSCRHLKFTDSIVNFTNFYACHFEHLSSNAARFYWTEFYKCDIFGANFENTSLVNFIIEDCSANSFSFNRVEVDNIIYLPPKKEWHSSPVGTYETVKDNYKRFRVLFQNNGHRKEAGAAYFNERLYEFKYNFGSLNIKRTHKHIWKKDFKKLASVISDFASLTIWGFGEKPIRTMLCSLVIIAFYTAIYYCSGIDSIGGNLTNSAYLSSIVFSTLGFGDFGPFENGSFKLLIGTEALLGAFTFGLFIAGYANKSKY